MGEGHECSGRFCWKTRGCECDPSSIINDHCCEIGGGKHVCCHTAGNGFKGNENKAWLKTIIIFSKFKKESYPWVIITYFYMQTTML